LAKYVGLRWQIWVYNSNLLLHLVVIVVVICCRSSSHDVTVGLDVIVVHWQASSYVVVHRRRLVSSSSSYIVSARLVARCVVYLRQRRTSSCVIARCRRCILPLYVQNGHSPDMIKCPDFSLTFPDILREHNGVSPLATIAIWRLLATILIIFQRINWPNFVQFKQ